MLRWNEWHRNQYTKQDTDRLETESDTLPEYGYTTQGQIPNFPHVGGSSAIAGWNSPNCGSCWKITYKSKSVFVLAIDHVDSGMNIAESTMNTLTNGQAAHLGRIDATVKEVGIAKCGLTAKRDIEFTS